MDGSSVLSKQVSGLQPAPLLVFLGDIDIKLMPRPVWPMGCVVHQLPLQLRHSLLVCPNKWLRVCVRVTPLIVSSLSVLAPSSLNAEEVTEFSFTVVVKPPPGEVSISRYEVDVSGAGAKYSCLIKSSPSLNCNLTELYPAVKYTLTTKACSTVGCGPTVEGTVPTFPVRELNLLLFIYKIRMMPIFK